MIVLSARIARCGYASGFEVRNISVDLGEGELLLVTGRSGSGKTTLVRAITGTIHVAGGFVEGEVRISNRNIYELEPGELYSLVTYIPQEPWYGIIGHTVYSEVCQALSLRGIECSEVDFVLFELNKLMNKPVHTLSAGQVQRVLWAEAALKKSKLLVLDEPMVYLDKSAREAARNLVREALREDLAVVIVDHDPFAWEHLEPQLLVLENGVAKYNGRWNPAVLEKWEEPARHTSTARRGVAVSVRDLWFKYPGEHAYLFRGLSIEFSKGLLTAVVGPNGSGKTTLLKVASGILKPQRGVVERQGKCIYIPENPLLYFTHPTPREELLAAAGYNESRVLDVAEVFGLTRVLDTPLARVSTGERRRISLASAYLAGYDVYFVDEPTGGLDAYSAMRVLEALFELASEGKAVVVATHDERVVGYADEVVRLG